MNFHIKQLGRAIFYSLSLALIATQPLLAAGPGTTTGDLLRVAVSARALGMGEAYTAAADDSASLAWNPAGLSFLQQQEAAFMHAALFEGIHYERLAYAAPGDRISYGGSFSYLGFGSIDGFDNTGGAIGTQSAYSYNLTGGMSSMFMDRFSVGLTGSYLRQTLADESAGTFAVNTGLLYEFANRPWGAAYRVGFSALNLGPGLKFVNESDPLPRKYNFGLAALHLKELPLNLTADLSLPNDNDVAFSMGSEYWLKEMFAVRFGYAGLKDEGSGLRFGFGLKLKDFGMDYSFSDQGDLGSAHRVELVYRWGEKVNPLNRQQRAILKDAKRYQSSDDHIQEILALNDVLNTDPANDRVLKKMIVAHERLLRSELQDAVAQNPVQQETEIPSPEEFALQDLVPGQQSIAQSPMGNSANDPLGLEGLPDVAQPETLSPAPSRSPAVVPAPSAPAAVETAVDIPAPQEAPAPAVAPESDGILLKPSDIYGE